MKQNIELTSVVGTPYEQIVGGLQLNVDSMLDLGKVKLASEIGCLVVPNDAGDEPSELIVFSDSLTEDTVQPPRSLASLKRPIFNQNSANYGLGVLVANTPEAVEMDKNFPTDIAAYSVPISGSEAIVGRPELARNNSIIQRARAAQYVSLKWLNILDGPRTAKLSVNFRERHDGDAEVAVLATPPLWRRNQERNGIIHEVLPRAVLVKNTDPQTKLSRIGTFPYRDLAKIESI